MAKRGDWSEIVLGDARHGVEPLQPVIGKPLQRFDERTDAPTAVSNEIEPFTMHG